MRQYLRNARLVVGLGATAIDLTGLRIRFEVIKNQLTSRLQNACKVEVFNLSQSSREKIEERGTQIELRAGYGDKLRTLFSGQLRRAFSVHENVEWITTIYANEEWQAIQGSTVSQQWSAGTPARTVLDDLAKTFGEPADGFRVQDIGDLPSILRPLSLSGASSEAMNGLAETYGFTWGWVDGRLEIVGAEPEFSDSVVEISASTGMVGSPVVTDLGIEVTTLLNPSLKVHRKIEIKSVGPGITVGLIETRETVPTLHEGVYTIGEIESVGDTHGNDWLSKIKTFRREAA
ncbi:MAG: hypothetical protein V3V08_05440 [Nannocystaceae bacterium]